MIAARVSKLQAGRLAATVARWGAGVETVCAAIPAAAISWEQESLDELLEFFES